MAEATDRLRLARTVRAGRAGNGRGAWPAVEPFDGPGDLQRRPRRSVRSAGAIQRTARSTCSPTARCREPLGGTVRRVDRPAGGRQCGDRGLGGPAAAAEDRGPLHAGQLWPHGRGSSGNAFSSTAASAARFPPPRLGPGETVQEQATIEEPAAAAMEVRLDGGPDALATDDRRISWCPGWTISRVRVVWPTGGKHNAYVAAVLASWPKRGSIGRVVEEPGSPRLRCS